ncbi:YncE family protein [Zunongwangia sp. H14]|uniref:YncE family protein n=1 Tax=Zunongwangia sp. H14 TaxID=3240792 RepID=UPI003561F138
MKIRKFLSLSLLASVLLSSCSNDDDINEVPEPTGDYADGVIVLNEGSQSAGSISFLDTELTTVENMVFETVNPGMDLGNFVQSMFFDDENAYIISNGSNLITVVDRYSFEYKGQVDSGLNVPLYGVAYNGKAYVTNVAGFSDGSDDYIAVIDLESLEVEESVVAGSKLSALQISDDLIYAEGAAYGDGNTVKVFDPSSNSFVKTITLFENAEGEMEGLNAIEIEGNSLFALSNEKLYKVALNAAEEVAVLDLTSLGGVSNLDIEDDIIYFTAGKSVYSISEDATEAPEEAILSYESESDQYGEMYGFEVEGGYIYAGDAPNFSSNGKVRIYTITGEFITDFTVGVGPNGFYFN